MNHISFCHHNISSLLPILTLILCLSFPSMAQNQIVKLWPGGVPASKDCPAYRERIMLRDNNPLKPRVQGVSDPTLEIFLPTTNIKKRAAVIICPGGAYKWLCIEEEGRHVAARLAERGFVALVLKYRLPSDSIMTDPSFGPLSDALQAIRCTRSMAEQLDIDPNMVGIMGFSAGGHLAASASTLFDDERASKYGNQTISARPDFTVLGYPVISMVSEFSHATTRTLLIGKVPDSDDMVQLFSAEKNIGVRTPPAFIFHAADDNGVPCFGSLAYARELRRLGIPVDYHLFAFGGHGFGLGSDRRAGVWLDMFDLWFQDVILKK